ncbi:MAG TPA: LysR family transcriptional regulator [Burkholderiales bacterium]|jgi:LysR family glycine cleavage system transcriptional activator|nr:LysR family transcriptional regulator [Burkholderiales bacterium]
MPTPRPSLNALRAFEATVRLRSMSAAAKELSVTHGAVSRHIRSLEDAFGVTLLNRSAHSTDPTPEGARLAEGLAAAFNTIAASIEQIKPGPLTLSCSTSIMMYWLIPRIARFHEKHPDVELQFNMNYGRIDVVRDKIGVAIRNSMIEPPPDVVVRELTVERVGPVCSPEYLRSARIRSFEDLAAARRLAPRTRPKAWAEWAAALGHDGSGLVAHEQYDHFYLMIQAAICGLGIAPVPRMLVLDDLRSGKLVAPFGFVEGPHKLVLWLAPHVISRSDVRALSKWLTDELNESERDAPTEPARANRRAALRRAKKSSAAPERGKV